MDLSSIFKDSSNVINSIKQILASDKELSNLLSTSGGIFSLIGFSYEMYKRIKDKMKTDEQKALLSLIHISFKITEKILKDIKNKKEFSALIFKEEIDKKKLINELLNSFTNSENWKSYFTEHPAITEFKSKIRYILSNNMGLDNKTINYYFVIKFDIYLVEECKKNEDIQNILELRLIDERYENTIKFLEYLSNQNNIISPYNNKPLSEYFIEQDSVITNYSTWEKDEDVFRDSNKEEIYEVIDDFLNNNNERFIVIGATYGIGKTSLSKMIVSKYSNQLLELDESILKNINHLNYGKYFPLIIYLGNGLRSEFNDWSLEYLFNEIIGNDNESQKRKILLILDALDEYPYNIDELLKDVQKYYNHYSHLKILLTTRLLSGLDEKLSNISKKKYTRLLSFTPDKVTKLFEKYMNEEQKSNLKTKYGIDTLTFDYISNDIGITNDKNFEITNPLFAWMLILLYTSPELKIDFKENWSRKFKKALIYMFFVHYVISGKYSPKENGNRIYYLEKKSLRIIAKLKQLRKNELLWTECETEIRSFFGPNVDTVMLEKTLKSILHTYFFSPFQTIAKKVNFIHKTIMEYLIAEYYIECILFRNEVAANIGKPSYATVDFLDGLIEILNSDDEDTKNKFINFNESDQITLLNSFNYRKNQHNARTDIINTSLNSVRKKDIVFLRIATTIEEKKEWYQIIPNVDTYDELWIHRWIALRILLLIQHENINYIKDEIIELFKSSAIIPNEVISGFDLHGAHIVGADLTRADLREINLSGADLSNANLTRAKLTGADLRESKLIRTDLTKADLKSADLSGADLTGADLSWTHLSGVHLSGADLTGADLTRAYLSGADLTGADLRESKLIMTDLTRTDLREADLTGADLTGADLTGADLSNANLTQANLTRAKLTHSKFNNQ